MATARDLDELDLDLHGLARLGLLGELQLPGRAFPTAARGVAGHQPGESRHVPAHPPAADGPRLGRWVAGFLRCPDARDQRGEACADPTHHLCARRGSQERSPAAIASAASSARWRRRR